MNGIPESQTLGDAPIVNPIIGIDQKKCTKCGDTKKLDEFYNSMRGKYKKTSFCKKCMNSKVAIYLKNNPEKAKEYYIRDKINSRVKRREAKRLWRLQNPNENKERSRAWRKNNPEKIKEHQKAARVKKMSNPLNKLSLTVSSGIGKTIKRGSKNGSHWESLVSFNIDQLKKHLTKLFKPGMSWNNHGEWHIDHIIPISAFNFVTPEDIDFKRCWALENLQPLWAKDNLSKHAKIDRPFQPSLILKVTF